MATRQLPRSRRTDQRHEDQLLERYFRKLPKSANGFLSGYPCEYRIAWAMVAHTDSRYAPEPRQSGLNSADNTQHIIVISPSLQALCFDADFRGFVQAAPQALTISGNDFTVGQVGQVCDPIGKAFAEPCGIDRRKHIAKGIVRGNSGLQPQQFCKPFLLGIAEFFNCHPIIRPANHSAQGDEEYILELMFLVSVYSPIFDLC